MSMFRKMGVVVPLMLLIFVSLSLSAQPMGPKRWGWRQDRGGYVAQSLQQILAQSGGKQLSTLTGAELKKALGELSVARQKEAYVRRSEIASLFMPGAGQFMNHDPSAGALFLGGHIAVVAGTLVGAYFLLPSDLQFGRTNYFADPIGSIKNKWLDHSIEQYLPSAAVAFGGMILDHFLRHLSARNAGELARANIKSGKVSFQPEPFMSWPGPGGPRFGFGWRMRF